MSFYNISCLKKSGTGQKVLGAGGAEQRVGWLLVFELLGRVGRLIFSYPWGWVILHNKNWHTVNTIDSKSYST